MSNLRFAIIAAVLFGIAFAGISFGMPWASKGFPVVAQRTEPLKPDTRLVPLKPDARLPTFDSVTHAGREAVRSKAPQGDNNEGRNRMRLTAIETADAYAQAPCDLAVKAAFVVAASTYLRAASGGKAGHTFSTPMDQRVHAAITAALDSGDLSEHEFPAGLWTAPAKSRSSAAACAGSAALRRQ